jgi:hypothetical protein
MTEPTRTLHESEELQQLWARRSSLLTPQLRYNLHQSQDIAADLFDLPPAQVSTHQFFCSALTRNFRFCFFYKFNIYYFKQKKI